MVLQSPDEGAITVDATGDAVGATVSADVMAAHAHRVGPVCRNAAHASGGIFPASPASFAEAHVCPSVPGNTNNGFPIISPLAQIGHALYGGPVSAGGSVGMCVGELEKAATGWDESVGTDVGSSEGWIVRVGRDVGASDAVTVGW